jgi:hypothetical protein
VFRRSTSAGTSTHRNSWIWQITIVAHDAMMPSADRSRAMLNASDGTTGFKNTPATAKQAVSAIPANGAGTPIEEKNVTNGLVPCL